jgi:hypothetical protein
MTQLDTATRTTPTPAVDAARKGPVLIDPREFSRVAGGSPKGGWLEPASSKTFSTSSPKGGW